MGAPPDKASSGDPEPPKDCKACDRLVAFRKLNQKKEPTWFNGAVPSFGRDDASLLIVGLAPGLKGANRTGRPFTGDYAGDLLYATLFEFGFATGHYGARPDDGLTLTGCMITNAVRCVPPENKPTTSEITACRNYLASRISHMKCLKAILALGRVAHESTLAALGYRRSHYPFAHGKRHDLPSHAPLFDSFHCSRYNTNTGRLTPKMFQDVFVSIRTVIPGPGS